MLTVFSCQVLPGRTQTLSLPEVVSLGFPCLKSSGAFLDWEGPSSGPLDGSGFGGRKHSLQTQGS